MALEETLFHLREQHIYGSSRLGVDRPFRAFSFSASPSSYLGKKTYELTHHLGNVLALINDRKSPQDPDSDGLAEHFLPTTVSARDYYPFGLAMPARDFVACWRGRLRAEIFSLVATAG